MKKAYLIMIGVCMRNLQGAKTQRQRERGHEKSAREEGIQALVSGSGSGLGCKILSMTMKTKVV
jgi:hypothetical protein